MKILVLDNYDSFTYNLVQYIGEVAEEPDVIRNDEVTVDDVEAEEFDAIIISPGPGTPKDAGISNDLIRRLGSSIPILGVCLGHQCIADVYGGSIHRADRLLHGKTSNIYHSDSPLYKGISNPVKATRYHSLIVSENSLPEEFSVDAVSERDEIMGIHHSNHPVLGVQFHPESILTDDGRTLLRNFFDFASRLPTLGTSKRPQISQEESPERG